MISLLTCVLTVGAAALSPVGLRCEYLTDPVGIDTGRPRLSWVFAQVRAESGERGQVQSAYQVRVASAAEALAEKGDLWDSGKVESAEQNQIEYAGAPLASNQQCFWSVRVWDKAGQASEWSKPAQWTMGVVRPEDWKASWISATVDPAGPLPLFRRQFSAAKPVRRALLYVCGLGFHEVRLNGQRVTDAVFEPGWTNYRKTCLYSTYDVTGAMKSNNVLGVMLGNGMYNVEKGRYTKFTGTFGPLKLIAQLHIAYEDGTSEDVVSDESWKCAAGPIMFSSIYGGEDYDATREFAGWDAPGFDDSAWKPAVKAEGPGGKLSSAGAPPTKVMQTMKSNVAKLSNGAYVCDLGQNMSGRPCIKMRGARGATVKLIPGELLGEDGQVSQKSSGGPVSFSYTLKGDGEETWRPQFSYYGFRYVQVEGARPAGETGPVELPEIVELTGEFTYSSADVAGAFECSNSMVNRVHALILAAIRSNFQSVLTDCPHREKLGWLEVSHLLADGIMYNFDAARFYAKVEQDIADSQTETGLVPDIAPEYTVFNGGFRDSPEWGSASVINPWNAYMMYGDRRTLERHYDTMRRYVDYLGSTAKDNIVSHGLGDWYDIGPKDPGGSQLTSKGLTATGVYYQDLTALARIASVLGKSDDAKGLSSRAAEVRATFNKTFYTDKKWYDRNSQTANAMPVALGLVEDSERGAVLAGLFDGIKNNGYRVTAGDVGFSYLVKALTDAEQGDLLYKMVCQEEGPGYAMQLAKGATTLTEAWDAGPASSQNHCMLGHVEGWFYRGLAGIRADEAATGFRHFVLRPQMPEGLEWVKAHYDSVRGRIESEWHVNGGNVEWKFSVPPNTTATVYVPGAALATIKENGKLLMETEGVSGALEESGKAMFEAASGSYSLAWMRK